MKAVPGRNAIQGYPFLPYRQTKLFEQERRSKKIKDKLVKQAICLFSLMGKTILDVLHRMRSFFARLILLLLHYIVQEKCHYEKHVVLLHTYIIHNLFY